MHLPTSFCWTRFGTEAGQTISTIFSRKELEREANGGLFLWGIGNAVGSSLRSLIRETLQPVVAFSPIRSRAKAIDIQPRRVFTWTQAIGLDGVSWPLPSGTLVMSRGDATQMGQKVRHYALVCRNPAPLALAAPVTTVRFEELRNLVSGRPLGASQVTAVVTTSQQREESSATLYDVVLVTELAYPYFVELTDPVLVEQSEVQQSFADDELRRMTATEWLDLCTKLRSRPTIHGRATRGAAGQIPLFAGTGRGSRIIS